MFVIKHGPLVSRHRRRLLFHLTGLYHFNEHEHALIRETPTPAAAATTTTTRLVFTERDMY